MLGAVKSVAILKTCVDQNQDLIGNYVPFVANQAQVHQYTTVSVETLLSDFSADYGLAIPYHPMVSILNRCLDKRIVERRGAQYQFNKREVETHCFSAEAVSVQRKIDSFLSEFCIFAEATFGKAYSPQQASALVVSFLQRYDAEIILASSDVSLLPAVQVSSQDDYVFHKFILHVYGKAPDSYKVLVELAVGYLYASSVLFTALKKPERSVKNVQLLLDTRLLLRLVGLEGPERALVYQKLLENLKEDGARLKVFDHTIEEMHGILDDCVHWVHNPKYDARFAGPALQHFVENRYSVSDVVLFKANLETQLGHFGIRNIDGGFGFGLVRDQIDEQKLYDTILEEYTRHTDHFREWSKREILYRDVKSLSAISRIRKGVAARSLKEARAVFVTTNTALARAAGRFYNCQGGRNHFCECVTDLYLGTVTWLKSPTIIQNLQERKIVADAIAALRPDANLVEKYRAELIKLRDRKEISEKEYYFMRSHPRPLSRLEDKTYGDPDSFYDQLPEEILEELHAEMKAEIQKMTDAEISKKTDEVSGLATKLEETTRQSDQYRTTLASATGRIDSIANVLTWIAAILASVGLIVLLIETVLPARQLLWRLLLGIPLLLLSAANMILGLTFKQYFAPFRSLLSRLIRQVIGLK